MVYRGTWGPGGGRNPRKKGEDVFPCLLFCLSLFQRPQQKSLGREPVPAQAQTHLGVPQGDPRPIGLTDVLWLFHSRTDVAKMCLSPGTGDSAWQATGPIICDRGDTLAQGPNSTFLGPQGGPGTPSGGPQGASGPLPGLRADPGGGQKLSPPGDGRHLTDFVAN